MAAGIAGVRDIAVAIAAAVEEQGSATQEIAQQVGAAVGTTSCTSREMQEVSRPTAEAIVAGDRVRDAASGITEVSLTLRTEVDDFLSAMNAKEDEQRRWERVPGHSMPARIRRPGGSASAGRIVGISCGGVAVQGCGLGPAPAPGTAIEVVLPGGLDAVPARIARWEADTVGLVFQQSPAALLHIDQAMEEIGRSAARAAPAAA